jgi:hypothetical protein
MRPVVDVLRAAVTGGLRAAVNSTVRIDTDVSVYAVYDGTSGATDVDETVFNTLADIVARSV